MRLRQLKLGVVLSAMLAACLSCGPAFAQYNDDSPFAAEWSPKKQSNNNAENNPYGWWDSPNHNTCAIPPEARFKFCWKDPYNIYSHNCHNAAVEAVCHNPEFEAGILLCMPQLTLGSNPDMGHSVNWWVDETSHQICIRDPQSGEDCCFDDNGSRPPSLDSAGAKICTRWACKDQYSDASTCLSEGTTISLSGPEVCAEQTATMEKSRGRTTRKDRFNACLSCCDTKTIQWDTENQCYANRRQKRRQRTEFQKACRESCVDTHVKGVRTSANDSDSAIADESVTDNDSSLAAAVSPANSSDSSEGEEEALVEDSPDTIEVTIEDFLDLVELSAAESQPDVALPTIVYDPQEDPNEPSMPSMDSSHSEGQADSANTEILNSDSDYAPYPEVPTIEAPGTQETGPRVEVGSAPVPDIIVSPAPPVFDVQEFVQTLIAESRRAAAQQREELMRQRMERSARDDLWSLPDTFQFNYQLQFYPIGPSTSYDSSVYYSFPSEIETDFGSDDPISNDLNQDNEIAREEPVLESFVPKESGCSGSGYEYELCVDYEIRDKWLQYKEEYYEGANHEFESWDETILTF